MGLKTTYYLRTLAATQIEKSTLDAGKFGFTQKREYGAAGTGAGTEPEMAPVRLAEPEAAQAPSLDEEPKLCRIDDPDCEACQ